MKKRNFDITFSGLSLGEHLFTFDVDDTFFDLFGYTDAEQLSGKVSITMNKHNTFLEFTFNFEGSVAAICDRSGLPFTEKLANQFDLLVKFGEAFNDDDDEQLILPQGEFQVNVAQYIYELIVLSIPQKHIHPDVESGKIVPEFEVEDENELTEENEEIDPRWDKLKDLLN